ncbi:general stress protein [Leifsonia poae]|uniref:general stress protein n=1 Tax=Leifsonia poae TaxID=110933 RepID=UPI001CBDFBF7|nr:general stress protein [Leifsonia poae]
MSTPSPLGGRSRGLFPTLPRGEVVATYETYPEAQQAVDVLARADFPVSQVSIVGSDLKSVERVTGKLSWGRVSVAGAASGAWLGIFFGLLLVIFSPSVSYAFVLAAVLIGAGFGMLFGVVSYAINRRRRDYTSVMQVIASSYSVLVDPELANRARNLMQGGAQQAASYAHPAQPASAPHPSDPPPAPHPSDPPPAPHPSDPPPARPPYGETRPPSSDTPR